MYQWQNQHALPLVPGWILVLSDPWMWQEKLLCSVVTALTSTICAALHGQYNVGSNCDCKPCWSLDLSVLVKILAEVDNDHGTGPRRNGSVNSSSILRGLSQKVVDFCYNTRLCTRNSLKCVCYFYIHFTNILYKYGWNHSLNNKVMNVCLTMCQRVRSTSQIILPYCQRGVVKCFDYTLFI